MSTRENGRRAQRQRERHRREHLERPLGRAPFAALAALMCGCRCGPRPPQGRPKETATLPCAPNALHTRNKHAERRRQDGARRGFALRNLQRSLGHFCAPLGARDLALGGVH
jgi:hypothetical protein